MQTAQQNKEAAEAVGAAIAAANASADRLAFGAVNDIASLVRAICKEKGLTRLVLHNPVAVAYVYKGSTTYGVQKKGFTTQALFLGEFEYNAEAGEVGLCYAFPRAFFMAYSASAADFTAADSLERVAIWHYAGHAYQGGNDYPKGAWAAAGAFARVLEELEAGRYVSLTEGRAFPEVADEDNDEVQDYDRDEVQNDNEEHEAVQRELYG